MEGNEKCFCITLNLKGSHLPTHKNLKKNLTPYKKKTISFPSFSLEKNCLNPATNSHALLGINITSLDVSVVVRSRFFFCVRLPNVHIPQSLFSDQKYIQISPI